MPRSLQTSALNMDYKIHLFRSLRNFCLIKENRAGYGWCDFDFTKPLDEIYKAMDKHNWSRGKGRSNIRKFKSINVDDLVVVPWGGGIYLGVATGEEFHNPSEKYYGKNGSNQIGVNYVKDKEDKPIYIPRKQLTEGLQKRLKVRQSIVDLREFNHEILGLKESLETSHDYDWLIAANRTEKIRIESLKTSLLKNIQNGKTHLESGGIGLEKLVLELLSIEGYEDAFIPSKRKYPAGIDVDIVAERSELLADTQLLIQVKHHHGTSGSNGIEQLLRLTEEVEPEYKDYSKIFVTTACEVTVEALKLAKNENIKIITGEELVNWIFENFNSLNEKTKLSLGLSFGITFTVNQEN